MFVQGTLTLLWTICRLICLHVWTFLHACLFSRMERERERERKIELPHLFLQSCMCKGAIFHSEFVGNLYKIIHKPFYGNLKETYCRKHMESPISPSGWRVTSGKVAPMLVVSWCHRCWQGAEVCDSSYSTWFLKVGRLLPGWSNIASWKDEISPCRPIRIHVTLWNPLSVYASECHLGTNPSMSFRNLSGPIWNNARLDSLPFSSHVCPGTCDSRPVDPSWQPWTWWGSELFKSET